MNDLLKSWVSSDTVWASELLQSAILDNNSLSCVKIWMEYKIATANKIQEKPV